MAGGLLTPALLLAAASAREAVAVTPHGEVEGRPHVDVAARRGDMFVQWAELVLGPFPELRHASEAGQRLSAMQEHAMEQEDRRERALRAGAPEPCEDLAGFKDVQGHGCDVYEHPGSPDKDNPNGKRLCFSGEPRMPVDFYMLFASPTHGNAIDACCACGKGKDFGQKAWKYPDYVPPVETCTDLDGWTDSEGADCSAYDFQCLDGEPAVPEALILQYKDTYGLSAMDACCKCGREAEDQGCKDLPWTGPGGERCYWYSNRCKDHAPVEERTKYEVDANGKSALDSCCMCGGGTLAACEDTHGWTDAHGDTCASYKDRCSNGFPNLAEQAYIDLAVDKSSALDACCSCGGGHNGEKLATCTSMGTWVDKDGSACDDYSDVCTHEAPLKERQFYVQSATPDGVSALDACCKCGGGCTDQQGWVDAAGYACEEYADVCQHGAPVETDGKPSPKIEQYAVDGVSAAKACCRCGGGCASRAGWVDKDGYGCSDYTDICAGGTVKADEMQRVVSAGVDGISAMDACCACGGSSTKAAALANAGVQTPKAHPETLLEGPGATCSDSPLWADSDGYKCSDYFDLCDGHAPLHAEAEYRKYADKKGVSALDACCHCGGGEEMACKDQSWTDKDGYGCMDYSDLCAGGGPLFQVSEYHAYADAQGTSAIHACCRCGGGEKMACEDEAWTDKDGYQCADYNDLCSGGHALFAQAEYQTYANHQGHSALDACCRCGGGKQLLREKQAAAPAQCVDDPWRDSDGYACEDYADLCKEGKPLWPEVEYQKFATSGLSALHACCACGGGRPQA